MGTTMAAVALIRAGSAIDLALSGGRGCLPLRPATAAQARDRRAATKDRRRAALAR